MTLTSPRLVIVPFAEEQVEALLALLHEPDVRRYLLDDALVDRAWVEAEVRASRERFAAGSIGLHAVYLRELPDVLVGFVGFRPFHEPPVLELVYAVAPAHTGRGIAGEMSRAVVDRAFTAHGFTEVRASTDEPNRASVRVLERLGMTLAAVSPGERCQQLHFVLVRPPPDSTATRRGRGTVWPA